MTLKKLAEQILLRYKGSRPTQDTDLDEREIYDLIIKAVNAAIKLEQFNVNLPQSERFVPNAGLATYLVNVESETGAMAFVSSTFMFGPFGPKYLGWATENDEPWQTEEGDNWAAPGVPLVAMSITDYNIYFEIYLSGFGLPRGKTGEMLDTFMRAGDENSYIEFSGLEPTTPNIFAWAGIRDLIVTDTTIRFKYYPVLAINVIDELLRPTIGPSIDKLVAGNYEELLTDVKRTDSAVKDSRGRAKITLPAQPIALPRGMGIWHIGDHRDADSAYIPIQPGEHTILRGVNHTGLSGAIGRQIAYEWYQNKTVYFNKKASEMPPQVIVRLVVVDPETIGEYDLLPIPADMEENVIMKVLDILKADGQPDVKTDKLP